MTLPNPITNTVFADGELTTADKWYTRFFSVLNGIYNVVWPTVADTGWTVVNDESIISTTTACSVSATNIRKIGRVVSLRMNVTLNVAIGAGDISNLQLATIIDSRYFADPGPGGVYPYAMFTVDAGDIASVCLQGSDQSIAVTSAARAFSVGDSLSFAGLYVAANSDL